MSAQIEISPLSSLEYLPYLDEAGCIAEDTQGKIGVYAIFDQEQEMQYVGYSRDVYLSLKQHLIRKPQNCYWIKIQTITRPSRQILEDIAAAWIAENGSTPPGNDSESSIWTEAIDANPAMTEEEKAQYNNSDELGQIKIRKKVARRVEADIQQQLSDRGVTMNIRFNPKLKEKGLLNLK
ncbi:GIY-YIG nuclease family protein [Waterburya agarophytonicola K14]|uniref:GIY-YIG nuclease family protein n=1 Tax=Waterburya agarophytonicola KI4 TaxID=2874699 RepID=A0A964BRN0_9CYAN|nr:GIY-YIG nuclease family protein [Waterburya agarophytonicola]MCC0177502.1 GIY-YIG nuclease family protein [Waterburya agarophytonicola KI4]